MPGELLTHQFFARLVGMPFPVMCAQGDAPVVLRLAAVEVLPPRPSGRGATTTALPIRQEPFTLRFTGPLDRPLGQGMYRMTPETEADASATPPADGDMQPLDIFIVPIAREESGYVYEAVFG